MKRAGSILSVLGYLTMFAGLMMMLLAVSEGLLVPIAQGSEPGLDSEVALLLSGAGVLVAGLFVFAAGRAFTVAHANHPVAPLARGARLDDALGSARSGVFERDGRWFNRRTLTFEEGPFPTQKAAQTSLERPILTEQLRAVGPHKLQA